MKTSYVAKFAIKDFIRILNHESSNSAFYGRMSVTWRWLHQVGVEIEDRKINVYNISDTNRQTNADMDREIDKNELMR